MSHCKLTATMFKDQGRSTLNNPGLFEPKFGSNMDKNKCWVKNVISNFNPTSTLSFFNVIFLIPFLTQHLG